MHYQPTYNSRDPQYKTPYGAAASGTHVQFALRPPRVEAFSHASMTARFESWNNQILILKMPWQGFELGQDVFSVSLDTLDYVGLIWYSFRLETLSSPNSAPTTGARYSTGISSAGTFRACCTSWTI